MGIKPCDEIMTETMQIYRCNVCGNMVMVLKAGAGSLVCCGQPMELLKEKTEGSGMEKHVPTIERTGDVVTVKVGSIPHPMEENHYINWILLKDDSRVYIRFLSPGEKPEAKFRIEGEKIEAREYCNLHGLWKS